MGTVEKINLIKKRIKEYEEAIPKLKLEDVRLDYKAHIWGLTEAMRIVCNHPLGMREYQDSIDGNITFEHCKMCGKTW